MDPNHVLQSTQECLDKNGEILWENQSGAPIRLEFEASWIGAIQ